MKTANQISIITILYLSVVLLVTVTGCSTDSNSNPQAPLAKAGPDQKVVIGEEVTLDGGASSDPEGRALTYNWSIIDKPEGSSAVIVGATNIATTFILDKAGVYTVELEVSNGDSTSTDQAVITNRTPVIGGVNINGQFDFLEDAGKAERGDRISIRGEFFSSDITENRVTLDGVECEISSVGSGEGGVGSFLSVTVPDAATSGDLVVTVGEERVTAPDPVIVVILPIQERFREVNYEIGETEVNTTFDGATSGFIFNSSVSGKITHMGLLNDVNGFREVSVWSDSGAVLVSVNLEGDLRNRFNYTSLPEPLTIQSVTNYRLGVFTPDGEELSRVLHNGNTPFIYPVTAGVFTVESRASIAGNKEDPPRRIPSNAPTRNAIIGIPDIIFETD